ncbi:MAG: flagellar basal body L-ring protein FlgH [Ahrensia sp.]|nr:flagellar basal body L-ring protein FlgH [Ahrensia sp.]
MIRTTSICALLMLVGCADIRELRNPPAMTEVRPEITSQAYAIEAEPPVSRGSTWRSSRSNLYTSSVALDVGDLVTVSISINDRARLQNQSDRQRTVGRSLGGAIDTDVFSTPLSRSGTANVNSSTTFDGNGGTTRSENVQLSIAATVVERLPNDALVIDGRQEVRVNDELRLLRIQGVVRQQDIDPNNVISYDRIAEARISYGGRGPVAEVQRPPYGQRIIDKILPF